MKNTWNPIPEKLLQTKDFGDSKAFNRLHRASGYDTIFIDVTVIGAPA